MVCVLPCAEWRGRFWTHPHHTAVRPEGAASGGLWLEDPVPGSERGGAGGTALRSQGPPLGNVVSELLAVPWLPPGASCPPHMALGEARPWLAAASSELLLECQSPPVGAGRPCPTWIDLNRPIPNSHVLGVYQSNFT